jgi:hypothetical protein
MKGKSLLIVNVLLLCVLLADAQELIFSAQSSSSKVGLQSRFSVTFSIQNASQINQFHVPSMANFTIVGGPMQSSSFSTINGSSSSSISYTYYLQPKALGKFEIPAATAIADGKSIKSNIIQLEVVKGNSTAPPAKPQVDPFSDPFFDADPFAPNPQQNKNRKAPAKKSNRIFTQADLKGKVFARVDVDKTKVFQGQQITACYNLYSELPIEAGFKKLMSPAGFWCQDYTNNINPQACERVVENGHEYRKYTLRKTALFATKSGELEIPSVDIIGNVDTEEEDAVQTDDNSMLGALMQIFSNANTIKIPIELATAPVKITAMELPTENKPINFSQNVGAFTIEGNLDKSEITTDETCVLQYIIRGNGNIKLISNPNVEIPGDFESVEPIVFDTLTNSGTELSGYKIFKYIRSPRNTGELHIAAATCNYFNPQTNQYETVATPAYTIKVKSGKSIISHKPKGLPQDIHDIVNDDTMQKNNGKVLAENPLYWSAYLIPIFGLLGVNLLNKRKQNLEKNKEIKKVKNAKQIAQQRLSIAYEMLKDNNNNGFFNETSKAIWLYLSDKLSIPRSKLNKEDMWLSLSKEGISQEAQIQLQNIIQQCEQSLYAIGMQHNLQATYDSTIDVISQLENQLG